MKETSHSCDTCISMCKNRPCWATPNEIKLLIKVGYGPRLMLDFIKNEQEEVNIVAPAILRSERNLAPFFTIGQCTFLQKDNTCEIEEMKPMEGRLSCECYDDKMRGKIANMWNTEEGKKVSEAWKDKYYIL